MVSSNGFAVSVPEASAVVGEEAFASLPHGSEYSVQLRNDRATRCDATLWIDGVAMGTFRVAPHSAVRVERPAGAARKFTFLREGSAAALGAGVPTGARENGLIKVEFLPEYEAVTHYNAVPQRALSARGTTWAADNLECCAAPMAAQSFQRGGTALGEASDQRFGEAAALRSVDHANRTVLHLRLVVGQALTSVRAYDPNALAQPFGNAEPPLLPRWSSFAH